MLRLIKSPAPADAPGRSPTAGGRAESSARPQAEDPLRKVALLAAQGQREAQRTLLVAVGPALLRAVRGVLGSAPQEVEDTLQEAMVALHLAIGGFRGECTTQHFACRIAVQTAMNARRRAGYRGRHTPSVSPEELSAFAADQDSPAELLSAQRRRETLRQLLCELPEAQAEVLAFHSVLGYTIDETAAALGAPIDTVRSRLRNGLAKLRARVAGDRHLLEALREQPETTEDGP
jgi:RNA polymerase sigma-70 factor (ECF subfamily)